MTADPMLETTGRRDTTNGGEGFSRTTKGELFIAAISVLPPRKGAPADPMIQRVRELTAKVTLDDPAWVLRFDRWLRDEANLRTTTIAVACAFVHCRLEAGVVDETGSGSVPGLNRTAINVACLRADEPAEVIRYWKATYGSKLPQPVKRGVADAVVRLYSEWSALKHDGTGDEIRMGDVIELTHPRAKDANQGALFEYLINRRHGWKDSAYLYPRLPMIEAAESIRKDEDRAALRTRLLANPALLKDAGMTWENLSSLGPMDAEAWEAMIPTMGAMALTRNLRNFDTAGISETAVAKVSERLMDRNNVLKSRQFPFRWLSAYKAADARWTPTLEVALNHSLENVPELVGRTLIMVDCSGSMYTRVSERSELARWEQAALFGSALAVRCEDVVLARYGTETARCDVLPNVLETVTTQFPSMGGTYTAKCTRTWLANANDERRPFQRVVVITDEGSHGASVGNVVPKDTHLFTWNLGGAAVAHAESGPYRHTFGGLTDQAFRMIPFIEAGVTQSWPF